MLGGDILEITVNWQRVRFRNNPANVSGTGSTILQRNLYQKQAASRIPLRLCSLVQNCLQESYKYFPSSRYKQVVSLLANTNTRSYPLCHCNGESLKEALVVRLTLQV